VTKSLLKIQYLSDLHLEFSGFTVEKAGDVLVLAGDIFSGKSHMVFQSFLEHTMSLGFKAVIMVMGNHEGYFSSHGGALRLLRMMAEKHEHFHFLNRDSVTIDGIPFHGCPLWSDPGGEAEFLARRGTNDYKLIEGWSYDHHVEEHKKDVHWLGLNVLPGDVVVTHNPPIRDAASPTRYRGSELNKWYCNSMEEFIEELKPSIWISGHTHHTWQIQVGDTAVVGNCRGYARRSDPLNGEVSEFNPTKTITLELYDADEGAGCASS